MMNCSDFASTLVEYLDRRLSPERTAEAEAHFRECASCRGTAESHRRAWDLVGRLEAIEPSAEFPAAVRRRARRPRLTAILSTCAAAAALLAAVLLVRGPASVTPADSEAALNRLAPDDRRLLEELARDRTWELADNIDLARAFEVLEGSGGPLPEEDH